MGELMRQGVPVDRTAEHNMITRREGLRIDRGRRRTARGIATVHPDTREIGTQRSLELPALLRIERPARRGQHIVHSGTLHRSRYVLPAGGGPLIGAHRSLLTSHYPGDAGISRQPLQPQNHLRSRADLPRSSHSPNRLIPIRRCGAFVSGATCSH
ncbi:hypothetical protein GCM10009608_37070 [Pseudonocardia alaniniphila]